VIDAQESPAAPNQQRDRTWLRRAAAWFGWGALFALAYGQSPLFTSNQNQYFLHGLAQAGYGSLRSDWLANTLDPTPVFSWLVRWSFSLFNPAAIYLIYALLLGLYLVSLYSLLTRTLHLRLGRLGRPLFLVLLIGLHSAALRFVLGRLFGEEAAYLFEGGLAGQRLLGPVLQPSSFGVFLLLSLALFLRDRPYAASAAAAVAAIVHPTYLISAAALVIGYQWAWVRRDRSPRTALAAGGLALALVLPTVWSTLTIFRPTSESLWRQSAQILVSFRIPHHAEPTQWFGPLSLVKLAVIAAGLWLARRSRLLPVLGSLAIVGLALTLLELATGSDRLALLFPWRVSVILVPVGSGLLLGRLLPSGQRILAGVTLKWLTAAWVLGSLLAAAGAARSWTLARQPDPGAAVFEYVREHRQPGDVYLIPPKLQTFRLATDTPAFIDFKSIPYRDTDVIEWRERVQLADFFYRDDPSQISCDLLDQISERQDITHILLQSDQFGLACPGMVLAYQDPAYALYRYRP